MAHRIFLCLLLFSAPKILAAQISPAGDFSLGIRSTYSAFSHDGAGLGSGGQFRIRMSDAVNTDWFFDYITIPLQEGVHSTYYHIGWSVLYYPMAEKTNAKLLQPYILAGHCFDYNRKTIRQQLGVPVSRDRWGSAVQAGVGTHLHLAPKFDLSLTAQYMIHLTPELEVTTDGAGNPTGIVSHDHLGLEGHVLTTLSLNYTLGKLWNRE